MVFPFQQSPSVLLCCHPTIIVLRSAFSLCGCYLFFSSFFSFSSYSFFHLPSFLLLIFLSLTSLYPERCSFLHSLNPFSLSLSLSLFFFSLCSSLPSYSFPVGPCIVGLSVKSRHRHQPHRLYHQRISQKFNIPSSFLQSIFRRFPFLSSIFGVKKIRLSSYI